jgi:hypothetical protein
VVKRFAPTLSAGSLRKRNIVIPTKPVVPMKNPKPVKASGTLFVLASGPSLTQEDVDAVRGKGSVIVTNTTFKIAPWADYLFFHDLSWYNEYKSELVVFEGKKFTVATITDPGVERTKVRAFGNSGAGAISLGIHLGFKRIVLLGMDADYDNGKTHWHGDHPRKLGNARSYKKWPEQIKKAAELAKASKVEVLNASRKTKLTCFPRVKLEDVLSAL